MSNNNTQQNKEEKQQEKQEKQEKQQERKMSKEEEQQQREFVSRTGYSPEQLQATIPSVESPMGHPGTTEREEAARRQFELNQEIAKGNLDNTTVDTRFAQPPNERPRSLNSGDSGGRVVEEKNKQELQTADQRRDSTSEVNAKAESEREREKESNKSKKKD